MSEPRTIRVEALARVEGEGGLFVRLSGGEVVEARLDIYEPPRLFERLLVGKPLEEVPDITARICGICPVAYQMSTVHSLEAALGVTISPGVRQLRRLLYCGEWIESHALHVHLLNAPDFLGFPSGLDLASKDPKAVERGLRLKKYGNHLLEVLGGRAVHPINVAVGGFYRIPSQSALQALIPELEWGLAASVEAAQWVAGFDFPDFESDGPLVALVHDDEYPMNEGRLGIGADRTIAVSQYEQTFREFQVPHSTALHSVLAENDRPYLVGPLARVGLNRPRLHPLAGKTADAIGLAPDCRNPFKSILARAVELVQAFAEALDIVRGFAPFSPARASYQHRAGSGCAATESAPRHAVSSPGVRCDGADHVCQDRTSHVAKPGPDRARPAGLSAPLDRPGRRRGWQRLRAVGAELRSLHQLLDPFSQDHDPARPMTRGGPLPAASDAAACMATGASPKTIFGVGSPHGDDQAGWLLARAVADALYPAAAIRLLRTPGDLLVADNLAEPLVVCDAICSGGAPGTLRLWTWPTDQIDRGCFGGSHELGLPQVLDLLAALGRLPRQVWLWTIEIERAAAGEAVSPAVLTAITSERVRAAASDVFSRS